MFDFISNLLRPKQKVPLPTHTDEFFGSLVYFPAAGLWSGAMRFEPVDREIEILIEGDDSGPTESQRAFFKELSKRWPEIEKEIGEILFPPMQKWAKKDYDESNPWAYFDLRGIRIPTLPTSPEAEAAQWAISYWCPSVKHHFDVQMSGWIPDGLDITRK